MNSLDSLIACLRDTVAAQAEATASWHDREPLEASLFPEPDTDPAVFFRQLALLQHFMNYSLWHTEDTARRTDVDDSVIAACKRRIDGFNQRRNDLIEKLDECLVAVLDPMLPPEGREAPLNTESPGMAVDRLSILALKIYHMTEETRRQDASEAHRASCRAKCERLEAQRRDLLDSLIALLREYAVGTKRPRAYYQFKMYNDPSLNPELYRSGQGKE